MKVAEIGRPNRERYQRLADLWDNPANAPQMEADELHAACFADLKRILVAHEMTTRLEISLLHRHYDIEEGEALFDFFGPAPDECTTSVIGLDEIEAKGGVASMFQFSSGGECYAVRYTDPDVVPPATESDEACLTELGAVISKYRLENVLGVALRYRPFTFENPFPLWREQSSKRNRTISRRVVSELPPEPGMIITHFAVNAQGAWVRLCGCPNSHH